MKITIKDKKTIFIIISISLICAIFLIINIVKILKNPSGNLEDIAYHIITKNNIDYRVYINENEYIEEEFLNKEFSYVTDLLNKISITYNYDAELNNINDFNINYYIDANMFFEYSGESALNKILNKNFILSDVITENNLKNKININIPVDITLDYYNSFLEKFTKELSIPVDATLEVRLVINITNDEINKSHILSVYIPLGNKVFNIDTSTNFDEEEIGYKSDAPSKESNYVKAIIFIIVLIIEITISYLIIRYIINKKYSKYSLEKKRILKEYGDRIVTVTNFIKYDKLEVVDVKNFEELIDLSDEAYEPIFFFEKKRNYYKEALFSILKDKIMYRYIINTNKKE